jgi:putative transcriptional regulator
VPEVLVQGQLLVASSRLMDPNFVRTVILLVRHGEDGSLGLVLNRPLEMTVREACDKVLETPCNAEGSLFQGGPCEGPLMAIHTRRKSSEQEVLPGLHFTTDREKMENLLEAGGVRAKYFVGYSGWGPGQLEAEMETGSWITAPADAARVFDDNEEQWSRLMTELTLGKHIRPELIPDDPSVN